MTSIIIPTLLIGIQYLLDKYIVIQIVIHKYGMHNTHKTVQYDWFFKTGWSPRNKADVH